MRNFLPFWATATRNTGTNYTKIFKTGINGESRPKKNSGTGGERNNVVYRDILSVIHIYNNE